MKDRRTSSAARGKRWWAGVGMLVCSAAFALTACGSSSSSSNATAASTDQTASNSSSVDQAARKLLPASVKQKGYLVDGISSPNLPMEFQDPGSSTFKGFDIDLAAAIAKKLGLTVKYNNVQFEQLLPSLNTGRTDIMLSGLSDLPSRRNVADWIDYFKSGDLVFTKKADSGTYPTLASLCGATVNVASGTSYVQDVPKLSQQLCAGKKAIKLLIVGASLADSKLQINSGRANAAVTGPETFGNLDSSQPNTWARVGKIFAPTTYGIAIKKGNTQLRDAVAAAFKAVIADGTYAKIAKKWNQEASMVSSVAINAGK